MQRILLSHGPRSSRCLDFSYLRVYFQIRASLLKKHALSKSRYNIVSWAKLIIQFDISGNSEAFEAV